MECTVYIKLLEEKNRELYEPYGERWQFNQGDTINCEKRKGKVYAISLIQNQ